MNKTIEYKVTTSHYIKPRIREKFDYNDYTDYDEAYFDTKEEAVAYIKNIYYKKKNLEVIKEEDRTVSYQYDDVNPNLVYLDTVHLEKVETITFNTNIITSLPNGLDELDKEIK